MMNEPEVGGMRQEDYSMPPLRHTALHRVIDAVASSGQLCGPGPSKPTAILALSYPSHEAAMTKLNGRPRVASE